MAWKVNSIFESFLDRKRNLAVFLFFISTVVLIFYYSMPSQINIFRDPPISLTMASIHELHSVASQPERFLISTSHCRIYNMDPWDSSVKKYFHKTVKRRNACRKTIVTVRNQDKIFRFNSSPSADKNISCCFREIHRVAQDPNNYNKTADSRIKKSGCKKIQNSAKNGTKATTEFLEIECEYKHYGKVKVTKDYQAIIIPPAQNSNDTKTKAEFWDFFENTQEQARKNRLKNLTMNDEDGKTANKLPPPSVLIVGIDSISRLHMIRSLPKTKAFLQRNDFIEMLGYTKIYDNTFPNVMGALLGQEPFTYSCFEKDSDKKLDDCQFIWKNFSGNNYITALIEDSPDITAFNYLKTGFVVQPTDYYMRPMALAYVKNLKHTKECVGGKSQTEFMLQYMNDFVQEMGTKMPYFLFSWLTSIGHQGFNDLQTVDTDFRDLLSKAVAIGGQNTVIIFMSDHGFRYGHFRETFQGFYEEALPFFFIRMPPSIKKSHPDWYANLCTNSLRLTSPLDLHATLEDILGLSDASLKETLSTQREDSTKVNPLSPFVFTHSNREPGFRKIYSFFEETPINRTCESSGIPQVYCRCGVYPTSAKTSKKSREFGVVVISEVNKILASEIEANNCVVLRFRKFLYLRELGDSEEWNNLGKMITYKDHLVGLEASPSGARFETKVRLYQNGSMSVMGAISRINKYEGQNDCEMDFKLKAYCMCRDYLIKKLSDGTMSLI